jgi:hypothetical protein
MAKSERILRKQSAVNIATSALCLSLQSLGRASEPRDRETDRGKTQDQAPGALRGPQHACCHGVTFTRQAVYLCFWTDAPATGQFFSASHAQNSSKRICPPSFCGVSALRGKSKAFKVQRATHTDTDTRTHTETHTQTQTHGHT